MLQIRRHGVSGISEESQRLKLMHQSGWALICGLQGRLHFQAHSDYWQNSVPYSCGTKLPISLLAFRPKAALCFYKLSVSTFLASWPPSASQQVCTESFPTPNLSLSLLWWAAETLCLQRAPVIRSGRNDKGWDAWMASPTQWIWVWASSRRW